MYNISDFYYYSPNGDLTNSVQRQSLPSYNNDDPLWKKADERFFWNRALLEELIDSQVGSIFIRVIEAMIIVRGNSFCFVVSAVLAFRSLFNGPQ